MAGLKARNRSLNRIGGPIIALFVLGLAAVRPLFARGNQLACSDDITFHILRLAQYDHLFRQGVFFTRWAPDMAFGYGFPLFNFYAPLSYYFAEFFSLIVAGDLNLGIRLTFAFGIIASGVTIYFLAKEFFSQPAAFVAAVAYMYAPYQGYDVYFRGNLAESFAWWLMPLSLLFMARLVRSNDWRWAAPTIISFAAVILSHNAFALLFSPLLTLFAVWLIVAKQTASEAQWRLAEWSKVVIVLVFGLALTTFFWLPALIEREFVHTDRLLVPPTFVYWGNFVTLRELLALPRTVHPDLINPSIPRALGIPQTVLALLSLLVFIKSASHRIQKWLVTFFAAATVVTGFLMLPASEPVWDVVPLLEFVQFPWRFLGITALTLAFLSAAGIDAILPSKVIIEQFANRPSPNPSRGEGNGPTSLGLMSTMLTLPHRWGRLGGGIGSTAEQILGTNQPAADTHQKNYGWIAWLIIPIIVVSALYWFDPRYCKGNEAPTVADIIELESWSNTIGTTAKGEYLPKTADRLPPEPYSTPFSVADGIMLTEVSREPLSFKAQSNGAEPFELTVNVFDYPGWTATLNGEPTPTTPSDEFGLITLNVPAGEQTIDVTFRETPFRRRANWVSAFALLGLVGLFWLPNRPQNLQSVPDNKSGQVHVAAPVFVGLALFILLGWAVPRTESFVIRPRLSELEGTPPLAQFNGGIHLIDYEIQSRAMQADGELGVTVELQAPNSTASDYQVNLQLIGFQGNNWVTKDVIHPRLYKNYYESRLWMADQYVEDLLLIEPVPGTPPGTYQIELVVFDQYSKQIDPATDGRLSFNLGTVEVMRPSSPATPADFEPQFEADFTYGPLKLIGYGHDRLEAKSGDPFAISMIWETLTQPKNNETGELNLINSSNEGAFTQQIELVNNRWPTSEWREGDIWRGQSTFILPATLPTDEYRWELCANDICHLLGPLAIDAPEWSFSQPETEYLLDGPAFGTIGRLVGANFDPQNPSNVTLVWESLETQPDSYKVFVHLLNSAGELVAQSDSIPAQSGRPTTGWVPNEFVIDQHNLFLNGDLPAGEYRLVAGLYNASNSIRQTTESGSDFVEITKFTVE